MYMYVCIHIHACMHVYIYIYVCVCDRIFLSVISLSFSDDLLLFFPPKKVLINSLQLWWPVDQITKNACHYSNYVDNSNSLKELLQYR